MGIRGRCIKSISGMYMNLGTLFLFLGSTGANALGLYGSCRKHCMHRGENEFY